MLCWNSGKSDMEGGGDLILDEVTASVAAQLNDQAQLGVQISARDEVPETGPANRGVWWQIRGISAVFADLKRSTDLSTSEEPRPTPISSGQ